MHTRDGFQSSVSESGKSTVLPSPFFLSLRRFFSSFHVKQLPKFSGLEIINHCTVLWNKRNPGHRALLLFAGRQVEMGKHDLIWKANLYSF